MTRQLTITITKAENGFVVKSQGDQAQKDNTTHIAANPTEVAKLVNERIKVSTAPEPKAT